MGKLKKCCATVPLEEYSDDTVSFDIISDFYRPDYFRTCADQYIVTNHRTVIIISIPFIPDGGQMTTRKICQIF